MASDVTAITCVVQILTRIRFGYFPAFALKPGHSPPRSVSIAVGFTIDTREVDHGLPDMRVRAEVRV